MARRLLAFILLVALVALPASAYAQTARRGAWVDEVVVVQEADPSAGVTRLEAGDIQIYASGMSNPDLFRRVQGSSALGYERAYGVYNELTLNPVGPLLPNGTLNPFASKRIREAMNWLIDRNYVVREIYGGLAVPRWLPINTAFPDYARLADVAKVLERRYSYNPAKAGQVIEEEMTRLGAVKVGGKWTYQGKPVTLIVLIQTTDEQFRQTGDYVARLLEELGFTVQRRYGTPAELSPIWLQGKPEEGRWHVYTGGWITTVISRDQAGNFDFFYTPRGRPDPLWQAYKPDPEFDRVADRLARRDFNTLEERKQLFARAMELALQDSVRVWINERVSFYPRRAEVKVAADLAGGVAGAFLWPYTVRFTNQVGGRLRIAQTSVLTDPWNPIAGSNWIYDMMVIRATGDSAVLPDPFTGLYWPQRVQRAEVTVKRGLPVGKTLDWVSLRFADEIRVPADAWIDWDPKTQQFITVGQKHKDGLTANVKVVVRYDPNLLKTKWHDGSTFSLGDMVMKVIMAFDRAKPESAIYDRAAVPAFTQFQKNFRGFRIASRNPVVIEYYTDTYYLDAEWVAAVAASFAWPFYAQGPAPWHTVALGTFAEAKKRLAFSRAKAAELKVEHMNYIAGPSLQILSDELRNVRRAAYIPYEPTLRQFVTTQEATARWANLRAWYQAKGHFWIGNGPFYLEKAFPVEKVVHLKRFAEFPDPADKWLRFSAPPVPQASVSGPARVAPGSAASFDVRVTTNGGTAYAVRDIEQVKYLVFDARGRLALQGNAVAVRDGLWQVRLTADQTRTLPLGPAQIEVVVVSKRVSVPAGASFNLVIRR